MYSLKIEINFATLIALLIGIALGAILVVLFYCLSAIQSLNKKINFSDKALDVTEQEIADEIRYAQECFLVKQKEKGEISFELIREICLNLIDKIARKYYPNSKNPIAELSVDELILLDRYIMDKIDELLSHRGLRFLKRLKMTTVLKILNIKQSVDKNAIVKVSKKYNIPKLASRAGKILGLLNPANWVKHLAINPTIHLLTKKICTSLINLIGQETYHIYSKQAFLEPIEDQEINKMMEELMKDIPDSIEEKEIK